MVHQSMASRLQGWGHLLHWGHSHRPVVTRVILNQEAGSTAVHSVLVQMLTMSSRSCRALSKPARLICKSYQMEVSCVQVNLIAKHSSCERFIFCKFCEGNGATTCKAKVLPLVRKLCNARTRSLRAIAFEVVPFAGEDCAELSIDRPPERTATGDM